MRAEADACRKYKDAATRSKAKKLEGLKAMMEKLEKELQAQGATR
jgi:hypothetical protein